MAKKIVSLVREPDLEEAPTELSYPTMLKELSLQALSRERLYDYEGKSARAVRERIREVKTKVRKCLGLSARDLPARPRRVAERPAVQCDGFSITPVAIERGRGWYISGHLYVPDGLTQPAPAVLHVHGHSYQGKSAQSYVRRSRGLARRGFVVLFVDFPGADERTESGHALWYPVLANLPLQSIMVQDNSAALTYLAGLPFVDEKRMGVTGPSGGGNQTAFLAAVEDRLAASAPCIAPTMMYEHANSGSGAWCHCEAVPNLAAEGVEYHDLLAAAAPRPQRVFNGIRDPLFPIIGARRAVKQAAFAYRALKAKGSCDLEEHYCEHGCPASFREGLYRFFEKALKRPGDVAGPGGEGDDIDMSDPRLKALPKRPARFLTVADLYRARLRGAKRTKPSAARIGRLLGWRSRSADARAMVRVEGRRWLRVLLQTGDGAMIPVAIRQEGRGPLALLVSDGGKEAALARAESAWPRVAAFDWRGQGETTPADKGWHWRAAHYLAIGGEPLPGGRATDLIAVARWLRREGLEVGRIVALGPEASIVACLAASVEAELPPVELHEMVRTLRDAPGLVGQLPLTAWVPGLALAADIPQLLRGLGRRAVVKSWLNPGEEPGRES